MDYKIMANKKLVIIGGGFAGLNTAQGLQDTDIEITLIDKNNHHLFQPLLYQVATAALAPNNISAPIREILKNQKNTKVMFSEVTSIDKNDQYVEIKEGDKIPFDYLVLAVGARHSYFGNDQWEQFAPGLKTLSDALKIREKMLLSFEKAENAKISENIGKYLTFVIIGGGPTGVEMAGAIAETAHKTIASDFRTINTKNTKVILVEGQNRVLSVFPDSLSQYTKEKLEEMGVTVLTNTTVTEINEKGVKVGDTFIETENIIWAAGNKAAPVLSTLEVETDRAGRVIVKDDLSIPNYPNIFVIGDAANAKDKRGNPLAGLAPVAAQQGKFISNLIKNELEGKSREKFSYLDKGTMATIGKSKAVAQISFLKFTGLFAWILWIFVHILFLIGFRNRASVMFEWLWLYIFDRRSARLITKSN